MNGGIALVDGTWSLEVSTPFGKHPATLLIEREGGAFNGVIKSQLGDTPLQNLNANGDELDADLAYNYQGRTFGARLAARAEGDQIDGTIKVDFPLAPTVRFTGTRA